MQVVLQIVAEVAIDCHPTGFARVPELTMTALLADLDPAVPAKYLKDFPDFWWHGATPMEPPQPLNGWMPPKRKDTANWVQKSSVS